MLTVQAILTPILQSYVNCMGHWRPRADKQLLKCGYLQQLASLFFVVFTGGLKKWRFEQFLVKLNKSQRVSLLWFRSVVITSQCQWQLDSSPPSTRLLYQLDFQCWTLLKLNFATTWSAIAKSDQVRLSKDSITPSFAQLIAPLRSSTQATRIYSKVWSFFFKLMHLPWPKKLSRLFNI